LLTQVARILPAENPAYLVGGGVRDAMLLQPTRDLDIIVPGNAIQIARKVADSLNGFFYTLDENRNYGRVILTNINSERFIIDFTRYQGTDLESDLKARDFTVNAMAVEIHQTQALYDPLGGMNDLRNKQIRMCQNDTFQKDPIRILRGVRLASSLKFRIHPDTLLQMRSHAPLSIHTRAITMNHPDSDGLTCNSNPSIGSARYIACNPA
jgi:tRNA nucleotidyltransferase/poly(A) polymerase